MKTPSLDLFVFADALGWELARNREFLADLLPCRSSLGTLFGYSCTCDPSILTGELPEKHGHFSFFVYDPKNSPFGWGRYLGILPQKIAAYHRVRNRVSRWVAKSMGYTGYFQLYSVPFSKLPYLDYTEKKDIYLPGGILGGQKTIFEHWEASGHAWTRSDWRLGDAANILHLKQELEKGESRLAYLFTAGLDAVMHGATTQSAKTDQAFDWFEQQMRDLLETAHRHYKEVRVHMFSDHGMKNTDSVSEMRLDFEKLGYRYGKDYAAVWDSTMARIWFPAGAEAAVTLEIREWFAQRKEGRICTEQELRDWGCWFPDGRYGEMFYLLNNGVLFAPSYMNLHRVPAMHGYDPLEPESAASWLTSHPVENPPQRLEQVFRVMKSAAENVQHS